MLPNLRRETALNLCLEGSVGSFQVGTSRAGQRSLEVRYLLTHVGLNFAEGPNDALLSVLAPVREIFDFATLDFDEIMQRDIDDARVSAELIPYLLDERSADLIKLFPPIVVVVLPTEESSNRPADFYPTVTTEVLPPRGDRNYDLHVTCSGPRGGEAFQFEQPVVDHAPLEHDMVRLRINTHRTKLVIVDGQHRAMALLALYRNLRDQWTDARRAPFREYYSQWTPDYIGRFHLSQIKLPVILCTVPALNTSYQGDFDLKKAARLIFLTLNKTARKVSESRNRLLDDNDLIAVLMRRTLSEVKRKDELSPTALRIWNVELDQFMDKQRIHSPIAISGVNHVYYMIEHALLDQGNVKGVAPRSGRFSSRTRVSECVDRLGGRDLLGAATADSIRRDNFSVPAAETLGAAYDQFYGTYLIRAFEQFSPYDRHCRAVLDLRAQIEQFEDRQLHPILFEGQNIHRVFERHRENLDRKRQDGFFTTDVPQIEAISARLDATADRIRKAIASFRANRAARYLSDVDGKRSLRASEDALHPVIQSWVDGMYENVFTTVAFQTALLCGFFGELERAEWAIRDAGETQVPLERDRAFDEYVTQMNAFFIPRTIKQLQRLLRVFAGEPVGDSPAEWRISQSNQTFRNVVLRAELQPDQWPKYKYLLTEIWRPTHPVLAATLRAERDYCRREVFSSLHSHYRTTFCRENRKLDSQLTAEDVTTIFDRAFNAYSGFLENLPPGDRLDRKEMDEAGSVVPATAASGTDIDPELWPPVPADA